MLLTAALAGGLLALVNGPWLRVEQVAWAGERYTEQLALERAVSAARGDRAADGRRERRSPPSWSGCRGGERARRGGPAGRGADPHRREGPDLRVADHRRPPARRGGRHADRPGGARRPDLPAELAALPLIEDRRTASRNLIVGDRIDGRRWRPRCGSRGSLRPRSARPSSHLDLRITDDDGFLLVSRARPGRRTSASTRRTTRGRRGPSTSRSPPRWRRCGPSSRSSPRRASAGSMPATRGGYIGGHSNRGSAETGRRGARRMHLRCGSRW